MAASPLLDRLKDRLSAELRQRAEITQRHASELAGRDARVAALQSAIAGWHSMTPDEIFAALDAAGLRPRVDVD